MNKIIKKIFGASVQEEEFHFPTGTPNYILYSYQVSRLIWADKTCLLVKLLDERWTLPNLKKQLKAIEKLCRLPLIVELSRITALQRTNLIESGIAFVAGTGQVFIPFWGSYFEEKIKNPIEAHGEMTANAQLIFLYLCYVKQEQMNLTRICGKLGIPKSTCTRAIQLLDSLKLISLKSEGTIKWISLSDDAEQVLEKALPYMISPVQRQEYVRTLPKGIPYKISGMKALAAQTMLAEKELDGGYAVSKDWARKIPQEIIIDEQEFRDFGGIVIEIWKYDPAILTEKKYVDDISLLLALGSEPDERVQEELDEIRRKYGIAGGE